VADGANTWIDLIAAHHLRRRSLAKGELLFRQGDRTLAIYLVSAGRVRLVRHLEDGSAVTLHTARAGETLAEAALFAKAYHCDAVAEVPAELVVMPKATLLRALENDPSASLRIARLFAGQVRDLRARLEVRNIRSAADRVLAWLRLAAEGNPPRVAIDRPWIEIASELGLTHEAVYRAIATLERNGTIERTDGTVVLHKVDAAALSGC
jgi:CRP-like cAMP-binding protein